MVHRVRGVNTLCLCVVLTNIHMPHCTVEVAKFGSREGRARVYFQYHNEHDCLVSESFVKALFSSIFLFAKWILYYFCLYLTNIVRS